MAKILVADDNSNVQKTVTLALANLGIEVLAVSNGDAAVRKLADFSPDLVLADIFMPVKNGYEVCEYVKKDSRFAHVPVVLLVGAFDPLDEKEAQRVGADGILKKPFVPPDPLITMVKMLLERSLGERLAEPSSAKAVPVPALVAHAKSSTRVATEDRPSIAVASEEAPAPDFTAHVEPVAFGDGEHPVAFSQLLETPVRGSVAPATELIEPVDDEQILTSSRDATLGDPIFWRNDEAETEPESQAGASDLEAASSPVGVRTWKQEEDTLPRRDDALLLQPIELIETADPANLNAQTQTIEPLEFIREAQDETSQTVVEPGSILLDPADQASLTVEPDRAKELAANPIEWMASAPAENSDESLLENSDERSLELVPEASLELAPEFSPEIALVRSPQSSELAPTRDETIPEVNYKHDAGHGTNGSVEDAENRDVISPVLVAESAPEMENDLTTDPTAESVHVSVSSWENTEKVSASHTGNDSFSAESVLSDPVREAPVAIPSAIEPSEPAQSEIKAAEQDKSLDEDKVQPHLRSLPQNAEDTVHSFPRQDWAELTASLQSRTGELLSQNPRVTPNPADEVAIPANKISEPAPETGSLTSPPDPALVEAVVQRVLDKMSPQIVDIITKEFLRPIVQALVHREIEKN